MLAVTGALVYYAYRTIEEGKKNRRKDSIEKQLEKLYNPLFEIMSEADSYETKTSTGQVHSYVNLLKTDVTRIREVLLSYGHYLPPFEHDSLKRLFSFELSPSDRVLQFPYNDVTARTHYLDTDFAFCSAFVRTKRHTLMLELYSLRGMPWKIKRSDVVALLGKDSGA